MARTRALAEGSARCIRRAPAVIEPSATTCTNRRRSIRSYCTLSSLRQEQRLTAQIAHCRRSPARPMLERCWSLVALLLAGLAAGALNAAGGGGTFVALPALVAAGLPPVTANASTTVALLPGSVASAWSYRRDVRPVGATSRRSLTAVSLLGGGLGATLLLTPAGRVLRRRGAVAAGLRHAGPRARPPPLAVAARRPGDARSRWARGPSWAPSSCWRSTADTSAAP